MNLHDWVDELCDALDIEVDVDEALVLDVARDAAHLVERPAAPITTFLLGYAAGRTEGDPDTIERLAGVATELAARWDRPEDADETDSSDEPDEPDEPDDEESAPDGAVVAEDEELA